ncbi:hypothetical protein KOK65_001843 [Escherichia coli]|nr:hypothetical protein [Escherichia coli]
MNNAEQLFLNELDNKFWKAADKLRANMDAANYVLIHLKYEKNREDIGLFGIWRD